MTRPGFTQHPNCSNSKVTSFFSLARKERQVSRRKPEAIKKLDSQSSKEVAGEGKRALKMMVHLEEVTKAIHRYSRWHSASQSVYTPIQPFFSLLTVVTAHFRTVFNFRASPFFSPQESLSLQSLRISLPNSRITELIPSTHLLSLPATPSCSESASLSVFTLFSCKAFVSKALREYFLLISPKIHDSLCTNDQPGKHRS